MDRDLPPDGLVMTTSANGQKGGWILRERSGRAAFRYRTLGGRLVRDARVLARVAALGIPPAWTNVHVAVDPEGPVQAWGCDARGRKQYRYHEDAIERGTLRKYHRVRQLGRELPVLREALLRDVERQAIDQPAVASLVLLLIGERFFRVGNDRYAKENGTFGITTLRKSHVRLEGERAVFAYVGKLGVQQRQVVGDAHLVRRIAALLETPGRRLFRYKVGRRWQDLTARDVNAYLQRRLGVPYSAKDFRTWGGTLRAATVLAELGPGDSVAERKRNAGLAVRLVAAELGNTPAICRASYVHPVVLERYVEAGETLSPRLLRHGRASAAHAHMTREERALLRFLDEHFPDRRRRRPRAVPARTQRRDDLRAARRGGPRPRSGAGTVSGPRAA